MPDSVFKAKTGGGGADPGISDGWVERLLQRKQDPALRKVWHTPTLHPAPESANDVNLTNFLLIFCISVDRLSAIGYLRSGPPPKTEFVSHQLIDPVFVL